MGAVCVRSSSGAVVECTTSTATINSTTKVVGAVGGRQSEFITRSPSQWTASQFRTLWRQLQSPQSSPSRSKGPASIVAASNQKEEKEGEEGSSTLPLSAVLSSLEATFPDSKPLIKKTATIILKGRRTTQNKENHDSPSEEEEEDRVSFEEFEEIGTRVGFVDRVYGKVKDKKAMTEAQIRELAKDMEIREAMSENQNEWTEKYKEMSSSAGDSSSSGSVVGGVGVVAVVEMDVAVQQVALVMAKWLQEEKSASHAYKYLNIALPLT